jgi:hypothetical protein
MADLYLPEMGTEPGEFLLGTLAKHSATRGLRATAIIAVLPPCLVLLATT